MEITVFSHVVKHGVNKGGRKEAERVFKKEDFFRLGDCRVMVV